MSLTSAPRAPRQGIAHVELHPFATLVCAFQRRCGCSVFQAAKAPYHDKLNEAGKIPLERARSDHERLAIGGNAAILSLLKLEGLVLGKQALAGLGVPGGNRR